MKTTVSDFACYLVLIVNHFILNLIKFFQNIQEYSKQESQRAYGTAVSGVVIRVNKIHQNHCQILTIAQCSNNNNPNLVQSHLM